MTTLLVIVLVLAILTILRVGPGPTGPLPSPTTLPAEGTQWNPRIGNSGDDRYRWPDDHPFGIGQSFDYLQYPSQSMVDSLQGWNQILCRFNRFSLRDNTRVGWYAAHEFGPPPQAVLDRNDYLAAYWTALLPLLKSGLDSAFGHKGYGPWPWTYPTFDSSFKDFAILGTDIMELRKALDVIIASEFTLSSNRWQEIGTYSDDRGYLYGNPVLAESVVNSGLYDCAAGSPPRWVTGTLVNACVGTPDGQVFRHHVSTHGGYHSYAARGHYALFLDPGTALIMPPAAECTEVLARHRAIPLYNWGTNMEFAVFFVGEDGTTVCSSPPPPCNQSLWKDPPTLCGSFLVDLALLGWPKDFDVPIDWSAIDPRVPGARRPIIGLLEKNVYDRTLFPTDVYPVASLPPALNLSYPTTLIFHGF